MSDPAREYEFEHGHDYPPAAWTVPAVADALSRHGAGAPLPTYDDAAVWADIAGDEGVARVVEGVSEHARRAAEEPLAPITATRYLDYERTGNRGRYEAAYFERLRRLSSLALATCLDRTDEYLDAVLDHAWALCEQSTWLLPAHLPDEERRAGLPVAFDPGTHYVALFSARAALVLAEVDHLLGDRLHPQLRTRIRREVDRRVFGPYEGGDHWWLHPPVGNWCAVCNAGVVCAALYLLDDPERVAGMVVRAADSLEGYVDSFDADGCSSEGIGYWNFGFGHYVALAAHLETATGGECSLLSPPVVAEAARFPLRIELGPGRYLPFSDTEPWMDALPFVLSGAGERLGEDALRAAGRRAVERRSGPYDGLNSENLIETLRNLAWARPTPEAADPPTPAPREFFAGHAWWLARADPGGSDGLVLAAKGGHNDEHHNHNDCGSFVCHYRGESLLADLGRPSYDRDFFGDGRYDYLAARSLGHSVPLVNGVEQAVGREYAAAVRDRTATDERDALTLELADCYPEAAGLDSLVRRVELDRTAGPEGRAVVTDAVEFAGDADGRTWASVVVSYFPMEVAEGSVVVRGERNEATVRPVAGGVEDEGADVGIDGDRDPSRGVSVEVEHLADAVDVTTFDRFDAGARDVWRARFVPDGGERRLSLVVTPRPR